MKKERGITLIALVITIIVLLILAGVSISLTLGNNGVLNQATNAVETNRKASAKEEVEIAWAGAESDYWSEWTNNSAFTKNANFYDTKLKAYLSSTGHDISVTDGEDEGTYEVNYTSNDQNQPYTFLLDANGKAIELSLGVEITPSGVSNSLMSDKVTQEEVASLYGKPISYTPADKLSDRATSNTWRIFYVDTEGTFDRKGSVYLKMDCDANEQRLLLDDRISTSSELKRMAKMNTLFANGAESITLDSTNGSKGLSYLYDEDVWGIYVNPTYAKYAVGGASVDLFVASYNSFINNTAAIGTLLTPKLSSWGYTYSTDPYQYIGNLSGSNNMYHPGTGNTYWIASPAVSSNCISSVLCRNNSSLSFTQVYSNTHDARAFCPIVLLKSTQSSGYEIVWDTSTNQYKFQAKTN